MSSLTPVQMESLRLLCSAVASDKALRRWFLSLGGLPSNLRANAIMQITSEMRQNGEDPRILGALCALSDPEVYAAAVESVNSLT